MQMKEGEKINKYVNHTRKQLWNMKVTVITIICGTFKIVSQNFAKKLSELIRVKISKNT